MLCSNCHNDIDLDRWKLHEAYCERHNYFCQECKQTIHNSNRVEHDTEFHTPIECGCGETIEKPLFDKHKETECANRTIPCLYCECPLQFYALIKHEEECGSRTEQCGGCDAWVQFRTLNNHVCKVRLLPEPELLELPELPEQLISSEIVVCPFCTDPLTDYVALQEHIFSEHPEQIV